MKSPSLLSAAQRHRAFTLVELLVVIAIIGVLMALLLPGVQAARESARSIQCSTHLAQMAMAVSAYQDRHRYYPPGVVDDAGPVRNLAEGKHFGWICYILPHMEEGNAFRAIDFSTSAYAPENERVRGTPLRWLNCPSSPVDARLNNVAISSYAACYHDVESPIDANNNGVFFLNSRISLSDVRDGSSHTIYLGENGMYRQTDLGWMSGPEVVPHVVEK